MSEYRPDRLVSLLTKLVTALYYLLVVAAVTVLTMIPVSRLLFADQENMTWALQLPVIGSGAADTVTTRWGAAELQLAYGMADFSFPIGVLPWWMVGVVWLNAAVIFLPAIIAFHQLRRIFERARDGAPFDAQNATRLRWLGIVLIVWTVLESAVELASGLLIRHAVPKGAFEVSTIPDVDPTIVLVALATIALAEVFRRGAELEDEQALVV